MAALQFKPKSLLPALGICFVLMLTLFVWDVPTTQTSNDNDLMIYSVRTSSNKQLLLYDPQQNVSTPIFVDTNFGSFSLNINGILAVSVITEDKSDILLLDVLSDNPTHTNITQNPELDEHPLGWSLDGRYLAFQSSTNSDDQEIFIWDSQRQTSTNITPHDLEDNGRYYRIVWSSGGKLAFTVWYTRLYGEAGDQSEIYVWDGKATMNLSQNRTGIDESPEWSEDGTLAFLSVRNDVYDIYIWDGETIKNNLPDIDTFVNAAPELTMYMSSPTWTSEGHVAFLAFGSEPDAQIYVWDGRTVTNMSQNPSLHNGAARWTKDGRWAFVTFFSSKQLLYVRDGENKTILQVQGQYQPAWSPNGYLAFCDPDPSSGNWILSVWDGQQIQEVAKADDIYAKWANDDYVPCSSG
jgi:hypothetical protein